MTRVHEWGTGYPWHGSPYSTNEGNTSETQVYHADNVRVTKQGTVLHCERLPEPHRWKMADGTVKLLPYQSGMITTYDLYHAQAPCYIEASYTLPPGKLWSGFWLLPVSMQWPPEINVTEHWLHDHVTHNLHAKGLPTNKHQVKRPLHAGKHRYGVLWLPDRLEYYIDDTLSHVITDYVPMQPMYIILNLGTSATTDNVPADMTIHYLGVWQPT